MEKRINLGKSVRVKGDLIGSEDLTIEGTLEGRILLKDHQLTIGENGRITADVEAKSVVVMGKLIGDVTATDAVRIVATGSMRGDIRSPRVMLADGAEFHGSIDMVGRSAAPRSDAPTPIETSKRAGTATGKS